jgi:uncharacterized membrane protein
MSLKTSLVAAASLGIAGGLAKAEANADNKPAAEEKCYGANSCKGTSKCGVSKSDVEATKSTFGDKFSKTKTHDCAGMNECGGSKGVLAWTMVPKGTCIKDKGGFMIESKDGKKVVVSK